MKKRLFVLSFLVLLTGCATESKQNMEPEASVEGKQEIHVEVTSAAEEPVLNTHSSLNSSYREQVGFDKEVLY